MPSLQLADIPTRASTVPTAVAEEAGVSVLRHELFTNDVLYLEAAVDLRPVPPSLLHLVPLFCRRAGLLLMKALPSAPRPQICAVRHAVLGVACMLLGDTSRGSSLLVLRTGR